MVMKCWLGLGLLAATLALVGAEDSRLQFSLVLVRHGSASPAYPIPTMSWDDWPEGAPEVLTAMGQREQFLLGHELRRRYEEAGIANQSLLIHQTMVRSIGHSSAIASAQAFIRGYLRTNEDKLSEAELKVARPPMAVNEYFVRNIRDHVLPYGLGTLPYHTHYPHLEDIFDLCSCERANEQTWEQLNKSEDVKNITKQFNTSFVEIVKAHYKFNESLLTFPEYVPLLQSIDETHRQYKETWMNESELYNVTEFARRLSWYIRSGDSQANGYRATPVLQYVVKFFEDIFRSATSDPERKEQLKVGFVFVEEDLLTSLLSFLNNEITNPMPGSSIVSFELYGPRITNVSKEANYTMKMSYNDREYPIGSCSFPKCTLPAFKEYVDQISIKGNLKELCKTSH